MQVCCMPLRALIQLSLVVAPSKKWRDGCVGVRGTLNTIVYPFIKCGMRSRITFIKSSDSTKREWCMAIRHILCIWCLIVNRIGTSIANFHDYRSQMYISNWRNRAGRS
jgi:hypothetical protein